MISRLKWSKWDWLIMLVLFIVIVRIVAYGSGLQVGIHTVFHWLAIGAQWLGTLIAQVLNLA
jgi:hypothetical protein